MKENNESLPQLAKMWAVYVKYDDLVDWRVYSAEPDEDEAKYTASYLEAMHPKYGVKIIEPLDKTSYNPV